MKDRSPEKFYLYDWNAAAAKAPSVVPERDRKSIEFTVRSVTRVPSFPSPAVLAPYDFRMDFDTRVEGTVGEETKVLETAAPLFKAEWTPGTVLVLQTGSKQPDLVYGVSAK